jgi:hypothetical protein
MTTEPGRGSMLHRGAPAAVGAALAAEGWVASFVATVERCTRPNLVERRARSHRQSLSPSTIAALPYCRMSQATWLQGEGRPGFVGMDVADAAIDFRRSFRAANDFHATGAAVYRAVTRKAPSRIQIPRSVEVAGHARGCLSRAFAAAGPPLSARASVLDRGNELRRPSRSNRDLAGRGKDARTLHRAVATVSATTRL